MATVTTKWFPENIDILKKLISQKVSTTEIAIKFNTTRNAIIGVCARKKISLNGRIVFTDKKIKENKQINLPNRFILKSFHSKKLPPERKIKHKPINLLDRQNGQCRFIIGEPKNQKCCGKYAPTDIYCEHHHAICYVPLKTKNQDEQRGVPLVIQIIPTESA